ncbi:MAG: hypothetical protein SW833_02470 [Cyanobacteriota bacterium]|nr:hypothetical protein [Cyanobacteriota bacterium]
MKFTGDLMSATGVMALLMSAQFGSILGLEKLSLSFNSRFNIGCCNVTAILPTDLANSYDPPDRGSPDRTQGSGSRV